MKKRMAALGCCIGMSVLLGACGAKLDVQENDRITEKRQSSVSSRRIF